MRLAAEGDRPTGCEAVEGFLRFFRSEAIAHFREEEEVIFPLVALHESAPTAGIHRVLSEHVVMHALVRELDEQAEAGDPSGETMLRLAELLKAHVRFEEDELFPAIEELAADSCAMSRSRNATARRRSSTLRQPRPHCKQRLRTVGVRSTLTR